MNKLQIMAKYLPYNVQYLVPEIPEEERISFLDNMPVLALTRLTNVAEYWEGEEFPYQLLLRPLESLTEGEWLGVFKAGLRMIDIEHPSFTVDRLQVGSMTVIISGSFALKSYYVSFDKQNGYIGYNAISVSPLMIIESLYALHVDIHGAIKKGFAVDKTKDNKQFFDDWLGEGKI